FLRRLLDLRRDAVSTVHQPSAGGDLIDMIHEDHAQGAKPLHDMLVVDDFVIDVERSPQYLNGRFESCHRHVDAGAKTSRTSKYDLHGVLGDSRRRLSHPCLLVAGNASVTIGSASASRRWVCA